MKYGESLFDILYLLITICIGIKIILKGNNKLLKLMGIATITLGCGDAFHLVPRILNYFITYDFSFFLGIGKLITSITMTIFYILIYYIYLENYKVEENNKTTIIIWLLAIIRIILCLFPQNNWFTNESSLLWGITRNIPFTILGILLVIMYIKKRKEDILFKDIWLYITLSFVFYLIVVIGASTLPILGMFMLPKTICYILIILSFKNKLNKNTK